MKVKLLNEQEEYASFIYSRLTDVVAKIVLTVAIDALERYFSDELLEQLELRKDAGTLELEYRNRQTTLKKSCRMQIW